ncbi:MAG: hypothetical protein MZV64_01065 [Ignavibacteriales bacterium]|nr:hypothetical protein [Ignavibacteriales bacterium]
MFLIQRLLALQIQMANLNSLLDQNGKTWSADIFISNSDAASFRGQILG